MDEQIAIYEQISGGIDWRLILITSVVSIVMSIITFFITTVWYQSRKEKRQDKVNIFKQLMATRGILDYESVKAINSIPVVFNGTKTVTENCVAYVNSLRVEGEMTEALLKIVDENEQALLKAIAEHLGYKGIDINAINNKYNPIFLSYGRKRDEKIDGYMERLFGTAMQVADNMLPRGIADDKPNPIPPKKKGR